MNLLINMVLIHFRIYLVFVGPYDEEDWNDKGIKGIYRFLNKIWNISTFTKFRFISKK